jgi:hypothetical protein
LTDTNLRDVYLTRFLNVISEPLVLESSTKDIEVNEGDSVTLTCNAQGLLFQIEKFIIFYRFSSGYPTPKIEWQKADARPLSSGHIRQAVRCCFLLNNFLPV